MACLVLGTWVKRPRRRYARHPCWSILCVFVPRQYGVDLRPHRRTAPLIRAISLTLKPWKRPNVHTNNDVLRAGIVEERFIRNS